MGSEISGSRRTVIVNQNFYFSDDDWEKLLRLRVRQLGLFLNCEITGANFFKFYFFRNSWISVILNWRLSTAGESRVTGLRLASLSRGRHDTPRPSQTARHELTISPNYTKTRKPKTHGEISGANFNIWSCVLWTILSEFRCVTIYIKAESVPTILLTSA